MPDTRTCDACGRRYTFTSYKDRCPFCCPKWDDKTDDYELDDWGSGDDLTPESDLSMWRGFLCAKKNDDQWGGNPMAAA